MGECSHVTMITVTFVFPSHARLVGFCGSCRIGVPAPGAVGVTVEMTNNYLRETMDAAHRHGGRATETSYLKRIK